MLCSFILNRITFEDQRTKRLSDKDISQEIMEIILTWFVCNIFAKYWAPSESIRLARRSIVVKVYFQEEFQRTKIFSKQMTIFICNASAKCLVPLDSRWFDDKMSVVNV